MAEKRYVRLATVWILFIVATAMGPLPSWAEDQPEGRYVDVKGRKVFYVTQGQGDPMILLHGIPSSSFLYRKMIGPLSQHFRVYAPDLLGFGKSDKPEDFGYDNPAYTQFLLHFMDALGISQATLVCHDIGGSAGLRLTVEHPERVDHLIILDSPAFSSERSPFLVRLFAVPVLGEILTRVSGRWGVAKAFRDGLFHKAVLTEDVIDAYYEPGQTSEGRRAILKVLRASNPDHYKIIEEGLGKIDKPTLIIWADHDVYIPLQVGERLHREMKGSTLKVLESCGHFMQEERAEEVVTYILEFMGKTAH